MTDRTTPPPVKPFGHLTLPEPETRVLSNGLTLHCLEGGEQAIARLDLVAAGGTTDAASPCIASFTAELLREGNPKMTGEEIADLFDFNGAWFTTNASPHFTTMSVTTLSSKLHELARTLTDCFINPTLPETAFGILRAKVAAQQKTNLTRVSYLAKRDNRRIMAGAGHPEAKIPMPEEIMKIERAELAGFHSRMLNAAHTHAYLCGRYSPGDVDRLCKLLEEIPAHAHAPSPINIIPYRPEAPCTSCTGYKDSLQSAVVMSLPSIPRSHPDYNDLRLTVTALGGYFGSRLMSNIREDKGYTYGISSALCGTREGSYVTISAQCDPAYTDALIEETRNELLRMTAEPLSADELRRLKFNASTDLATTLDSPVTVMDYYQLRLTAGVPDDYFYARQAAIASLTSEKCAEISGRYLLPEQLRTSIAGPA